MHYRQIPALAAYIDRIGADELNFRRFIIRDWRGAYYRQKTIITIEPDGSIHCTSDEHAPTTQEATAIKAALEAITFPKSMQATPAKLRKLKEMITEEDPILFEFYDQTTGNLIMVQQRVEPRDGRKFFRPWSYWSDNEWRMMEPDGKLPFWKPRRATDKSRIMIHEGAKAAKFVTDMLADEDRKNSHPWGKFLDDYEHWGMIGGALSPQRADYKELRDVNPVEVVYVCDNDPQGKEAITTISRMYRRKLRCIYFDARWPAGWDMADPIPAAMYNRRNNYVGPRVQDLIFPATWATEMEKGEDGGRPIIKMSHEFMLEWLHCVEPEVYVHMDTPNRLWNEGQFNNHVRPFSNTDHTAKYFKRSKMAKLGRLSYTPEYGSGFVAGNDSKNFINTFVPSSIKPMEGDPQPWLDYMEHLVPNEVDRTELLRWVATLIARPETKIAYGVLLVSETQGVGKSTLGERILLPILGQENVSVPSEADVVDSQFNEWAAHKRLAIIHEIYAGHSAKAYNKLKSVTTDKFISINLKFTPTYKLENWLHIFACSNSMRALQLGLDDRRWLVPAVTHKRQSLAWWTRFNQWLSEENGLEIICWWAHSWLAAGNEPVYAGAEAPMTEAKRSLVEEGYSAGQTLVSEFLQQAKERESGEGVKLAVMDVDLQQMIKDRLYEGRHNDRLEKPLTIRKVGTSAGWYTTDYVRSGRYSGQRVKALVNMPELANISGEVLMAEIAAGNIKLLQPGPLMQQWFNTLDNTAGGNVTPIREARR